jgi:hypothetical protein
VGAAYLVYQRHTESFREVLGRLLSRLVEGCPAEALGAPTDLAAVVDGRICCSAWFSG